MLRDEFQHQPSTRVTRTSIATGHPEPGYHANRLFCVPWKVLSVYAKIAHRIRLCRRIRSDDPFLPSVGHAPVTIVRQLLAVLLLVIQATAQDGANPVDIEVQVDPLLQRLREATAQQRWLDAAQSFDAAWQQLSEGEDQAPGVRFAGTHTLRPGQHQADAGARAQMREIYRSAPLAFREEYQRLFDSVARRRLQAALPTGHRRSLLTLVRRYEFCDSSAAVVAHLVTDSLARGDLLNAAMRLRQLTRRLASPPPEIQLLLAELWLRAGYVQESHQAVGRLAEQIGYGSTVPYKTQQFQLPGSPAAIPDWFAAELSFQVTEHPSTWLEPQKYASRMRTQQQQPASLSLAWQQTLFRSWSTPELNNSLQRLERRVLSAIDNSPISPTLPIVSRDLVIFQGIGSLQAVRRFTGEPVWESTRFNRQLLSALQWTVDLSQQSAATGQLDRIVREAARNHIRGQLASDGQLLYCVEETSQSLTRSRVSIPPNMQEQYFNVLRVYDAATGRLQGQAGGLSAAAKPGRPDPFAATCFLGTPLLLRERILILAEDSHGIHLLDLRLRPRSSAQDAELMFEVADRQLLSVPLFELPVHPLRRYAGMTPSFSDGMIICQSCDEQVLGLAADDLSIEWVHRYRASVRPREIGGGNPVFGNASDDVDSIRRDIRLRPHDSLVRVAGSRVLLMPRDSDQMVCLDLYTGQEIWSRPRGDLRYVAALTDSVMVVAGATRLLAARLSDGSTIWQQEFDEAEISGQPAATEHLVYLPTRWGHLLVIDIANGRRLLNQQLSDSAIGNLLSVSGQLIAQSSTGVYSWQPAEFAVDPQLTAIQESLLNSEPDEVIVRLVDLVETATDDTRALARRLLIEQLLESIRLDYRSNRHHIPLLTKMIGSEALTPVQIAAVIRAALGLTLHDAATFAKHWEAVRTARVYRNRLDQLIISGLTTQHDLTATEVATQISEIIQTALTRRHRQTQVGRLRLLATNQIAATVQTTLSRLDDPSRRRAIDLLRPPVQAILSETSSSQLFPDPLYFCWLAGLAECLLPLNESNLDHIPAATERALVPQLLASKSAGWLDTRRAHESLNRFWNRTETANTEAWPDPEVEPQGPGNDALGRIADMLHRQLPDTRSENSPRVIVHDGRTKNPPLRIIQGAPRSLIPLYGTPGVYRGWQFVRLHAAPGILAIDGQGRRRWTFDPAQSKAIQTRPTSLSRQRSDYAVACGKLLVLNDNDHLYMLNAVDVTEGNPAVLWSASLDEVLPEATRHQNYIRSWQRTTVYDRQPDGLAPIGPLTEFGLPLFRGQQLVVLNPWTGRPMWAQDGLPDDIRMAASNDQLCLISESTSQIQIRNLRDGSVLKSGRLPDWWAEGNSLYDTSVRHIELEAGTEYPWRVVVEGSRCLMFIVEPDQASLTSYDFMSVDSESLAIVWQTDLPANSVFSNVCEGLIATLSGDDRLQIRQISDGTLIIDQTVSPIAECEQLYLRRSEDRFLVLTYAAHAEEEPLIVSGAVPLNGPIYALDTVNGSVAWTGNTSHEYLRILNAGSSPTLPTAPLLILLSRQRRKIPGSLGTDHAVRILDVRNGNILYEDNRLGTNLSYHALRFDGDNRFTVSFNHRSIEFDFSNSKATP